jgi:class 3 adenylate cyclase
MEQHVRYVRSADGTNIAYSDMGEGVPLARRICDHAEPGAVLVSDVVRQLAAGKGFFFADAGASALKGFDEPVRLYALRWREDA